MNFLRFLALLIAFLVVVSMTALPADAACEVELATIEKETGCTCLEIASLCVK